jgi:hypothetical protein
MTYPIEKAVSARTTAKAEAALQNYYSSFPARSRAVRCAVEQMLAEMRANPQPPLRTAPRLNDGEEYELERFPFETFVDGMFSPGT